MKLKNLTLALAGTAVLAASCGDKKEVSSAAGTMNNELDSVSYGLGISVGAGLKAEGMTEVNAELMGQALNEMLNGTAKFDEYAANEVIGKYLEKLRSKKAEGAKEAGIKWLEENKKNADVQVTASGLQYMVITEGTGPKPAETDMVRVHYHGTLIDGTVFDSSVDRGTPAEFPVNGVIKGWVEALQMMPVGSKYKLFIPSDLAYGDRAAGEKIGPGSTLIFEVELLEILKQ